MEVTDCNLTWCVYAIVEAKVCNVVRVNAPTCGGMGYNVLLVCVRACGSPGLQRNVISARACGSQGLQRCCYVIATNSVEQKMFRIEWFIQINMTVRRERLKSTPSHVY